MDVTELPDGTRIIWPPIEKVKSKITIGQVIGELLLTAGVVLLLFVGYKAILQDTVIGESQNELARSFSHEKPEPSKPQKSFVDLDKVSKLADIFGRMYVPRFGDNWTRLVAEGTRWYPVLNEIGVGHYRSTAMPGEVGNFAVAGHRGGFGGAFREMHRLVEGDRVYLETNNSWFVYKYLETEIVEPEDTGVIEPVPVKLDGAVEGSRYMTMTSCTPIFVNTHRIIAWFELEETIEIDPENPLDYAAVLERVGN